MVKGLSRRVVWVRAPDPQYFEEAIFIVREDASARGVTNEEIIREAEEVAQNYVGGKRHGGLRAVPAPLFALLGAAFTGLLWFLSKFF